MATIRDVARLSKVSAATVSHVLSGRTDRVSEETRKRVLEAVRDLRYRPSAVDSRDQDVLLNNISLVVEDLTFSPIASNRYMCLILDGVLETAAFAGWSVTVQVERMWDNIGLAIRRNYDGRCDGMLAFAPNRDNRTVPHLQERGFPIVQVGATAWLPGVSSVDLDNEGAGHRIGRVLIDAGHRDIAYFHASPKQLSSIERLSGLEQVMREHGLARPQVLYPSRAPGEDTSEPLEPAPPIPDVVDRLLRLRPQPTALMVWNDGIAWEIEMELRGRGYHVPRDISLASVDGAPVPTEAYTTLVTIRQPLQLIGKRATQILLEKIKDPMRPDEIVKFAGDLIIGESVGKPRTHTLS